MDMSCVDDAWATSLTNSLTYQIWGFKQRKIIDVFHKDLRLVWTFAKNNGRVALNKPARTLKIKLLIL